jgi:hypothetical protein
MVFGLLESPHSALQVLAKRKNINMKLNPSSLATILVLVTSASLHAQTLNYDFSFTGDSGTNPGTVTGEIFGLTDNSSSTLPTDIVIFSAPAGLGYDTPFDFSPSGPNSYGYIGGGLDISNGVIESGGLFAKDPTGTYILSFNDENNNLGISTDGSSFATDDFDDNFSGDLGEVTFTPVVPEPNQVALLFLGGLAVFAVRNFVARVKRSTSSVVDSLLLG